MLRRKIYHVGDFVVDPTYKRLIAWNYDVRIDPKTLDALRILIKHQGKLVPDRVLIRHLWGKKAKPEERIRFLYDVIHDLRIAMRDEGTPPEYIARESAKVQGKDKYQLGGYRLLKIPVQHVISFEGRLQFKTRHEYDEEIKRLSSALEQEVDASSKVKDKYEYEIVQLGERLGDEDAKSRKLGAELVKAREQLAQKTTAARKLKWFFGTLFASLALILGWSIFLLPPSRNPTAASMGRPNMDIVASEQLAGEPSFAISHDGSAIVFSGVFKGQHCLFLRTLTSRKVEAINGTDNGMYPFWSPDDKQIGFFADAALKTIYKDGGSYTVRARAPRGSGGTWGKNGILFARELTGGLSYLMFGPATSLKAARSLAPTELAELWPSFLPDNDHFLFTQVLGNGPTSHKIAIGSLDSTNTKVILDGVSSSGVYAPGTTGQAGFIFFMLGQDLYRASFDPKTLQIGRQERIASDVGLVKSSSHGEFAISDNGTLVHTDPIDVRATLQWYTRTGMKQDLVFSADYILQHSLSPNQRELAIDRLDTSKNTYDIWIKDLASGTMSPLTSNPGDDYSPVWSPDGSQIIYSCQDSQYKFSSEFANLCLRSADGSGPVKHLVPADETQIPTDWSRDGRWILYYVRDIREGGSPDRSATRHIRVLEVDNRLVLKPFADADYDEWQGAFSPAGDWIAYTAAQAADEVRLRPFPFHDGPTIVVAKGSLPRWSSDGKQIFYISGEQTLMAVTFDSRRQVLGKPQRCFTANFARPGTLVYSYAVADNGNRFLVRSAATGLSPVLFRIILDATSQ